MDRFLQTYRDHPKTVTFTSAAVLRVLLAVIWPGLPDLLTGRVEISTPISSFKRLQEGVFLYERGLDPYDGGIFYQAPLFLPLFSLLPSPGTWLGRLASVLLFTALDLLSADALCHIASSDAATVTSLYTSPRTDQAWKPTSVAALYLFNPYTLLACLGRPTTVFTTFFILLSLSHACQARTLTAAFAIAVASYISLHPLFLLPPIGLLCYDRLCLQQTTTPDEAVPGKPTTIDQRLLPSATAFALRWTATFTTILALLLFLSSLLTSPTPSPSWTFLRSVYLTPLTLPDLTPNVGLWWYFFTEIFDPFRNFFLGVFWLHLLSYSIPLCLRLRRQPLAACVLMLGVTAVFQPYASVGDVGAWLSCLGLLGHLSELVTTHRYPLPALTALLYASLLGPAFHHLWIYAGSGNANFFYAITLVWNLALLVLGTDALYAILRDEWEVERPEGKGAVARQL